MTDFVDPREEPLMFDRDPRDLRDRDAGLDPGVNEDLIDSAEADRLAAEHRAEQAGYDEDDDEGDAMGDTQPVDNLE